MSRLLYDRVAGEPWSFKQDIGAITMPLSLSLTGIDWGVFVGFAVADGILQLRLSFRLYRWDLLSSISFLIQSLNRLGLQDFGIARPPKCQGNGQRTAHGESTSASARVLG